ncbi:interleukin-1 receptor-like 2 isoform X1 [Anguilla rostrata]|uniref:interleukin-1 receptor-like 2 isoform X1 n=1 Tax=Anguilla rostrata TaxID=7938 RepID=UPI0030CC1827
MATCQRNILRSHLFSGTDMGQTSFIFLMSAVFLRGATVMIGEKCKDYESERTFSIHGEAAFLNCMLAKAHVFNYSVTPYNISWYDRRTGRQLFGETGRIQVQKSMLWFLTTTLEDAGYYQCVLRTPDQCFQQTSMLIVNETMAEYCQHPVTETQELTIVSNDFLVCKITLPFMATKDTIQWYKKASGVSAAQSCELIQKGEKYGSAGERLLVQNVSPSDEGFHTCRLNFTLSGAVGYMAMTIYLKVRDEWNLKPKMIKPNNEEIEATCGSPFSDICQVHVPGRGNNTVVVSWWREKKDVGPELISSNSSVRVHQAFKRKEKGENEEKLELVLRFTEVKEEDFSYTYVCVVHSDKGGVRGNLTLKRSNPDLPTHIALVFLGLVLLFTMGTVAYQLLKIDLALWCRGSFPCLYPRPGADGKAYDVYVLYPGMCDVGSCGRSLAEAFALHTLPQVLERRCGYKLFIFGRDSLPGETMVNSIRDNIAKSSHFLLLYTASTFSEWGGAGGDGHLLFAQQTGMHCALVEETLRVLLVELEKVTDFSTFPESLLHLRRKQGALEWWRLGGAGEQQLRPSSRFWKQVRYRLPPQGRCGACPERATLLNV